MAGAAASGVAVGMAGVVEAPSAAGASFLAALPLLSVF